MALTWQKIDKFKAYYDMEIYLNQMGKDYVRVHALTPEIIVREFKHWRYVMGRKCTFVRDKTLLNFTAQTCKHRIVTRPRYAKFKATHHLTNIDVARILGYSSDSSMLGNPLSWRKIELWMDKFEETLEVIETKRLERSVA